METENNNLTMSGLGEISGSWICVQNEKELIAVRKTRLKVDWVMQPQRIAWYSLTFTKRGWKLQPILPCTDIRRKK